MPLSQSENAIQRSYVNVFVESIIPGPVKCTISQCFQSRVLHCSAQNGILWVCFVIFKQFQCTLTDTLVTPWYYVNQERERERVSRVF